MATTTQQNPFPSDYQRQIDQANWENTRMAATRSYAQNKAASSSQTPLSKAAQLKRMRARQNASFQNQAEELKRSRG